MQCWEAFQAKGTACFKSPVKNSSSWLLCGGYGDLYLNRATYPETCFWGTLQLQCLLYWSSTGLRVWVTPHTMSLN